MLRQLLAAAAALSLAAAPAAAAQRVAAKAPQPAAESLEGSTQGSRNMFWAFVLGGTIFAGFVAALLDNEDNDNGNGNPVSP